LARAFSARARSGASTRVNSSSVDPSSASDAVIVRRLRSVSGTSATATSTIAPGKPKPRMNCDAPSSRYGE